MGAYTQSLSSIDDISKYFVKDPKTFTMTFIGESLELRIPRKFSQHGMLEIGDQVTTIGLMDMIFDDTYRAGLNILASITISPSEIGSITYAGVEYTTLHLKHGDQFMSSYVVIQNPHIVYVLWTEFVTNGGVPYWLSYHDFLKLFEYVNELTGEGIGVSRSVFECIISHICRDKNNVANPYRLTNMKSPMQTIALKSISQSTSSTTARLNGSYFRDEGLTAALRYQVDDQQPFENLLRGLSSAVTEDARASIL